MVGRQIGSNNGSSALAYGQADELLFERISGGAHMHALPETIPESSFRRAVKTVLPQTLRRWLRKQQSWVAPYFPLGRLGARFAWRRQPLRRNFGLGHGLPVDRYYIELFLTGNAREIRGRVLEIGDNTYTKRFGGVSVTVSEVLHATPDNPRATNVGDLTCPTIFAAESFDCIVLTQTLQHIYDVRAALRTLYRILKPGGTLLLSVLMISQICRYDADRWGDYWRFTPMAVERLLSECFPPGCFTVQVYGNVLTATAFLHGLVTAELRPADLAHSDPDYPLLIAARAQKPANFTVV